MATAAADDSTHLLHGQQSQSQDPEKADTGINATGEDNGDGSYRSFVERTFSHMQPGSVRGSIFTLASTAVGAGMLALPLVLKNCGIILGMLLILFGGFLALFSMALLVEASQKTGLKTYSALTTGTFGPRVGRFIEVTLVVYCFGAVIGTLRLLSLVIPILVIIVAEFLKLWLLLAQSAWSRAAPEVLCLFCAAYFVVIGSAMNNVMAFFNVTGFMSTVSVSCSGLVLESPCFMIRPHRLRPAHPDGGGRAANVNAARCFGPAICLHLRHRQHGQATRLLPLVHFAWIVLASVLCAARAVE
jgi:hypothetical protein